MPTSSERISSYRFDFPEELIAAAPVTPRDASNLLVLDRADGAVSHRTFRDLPEYLRPGDCLVVNRSKVLPARLVGRKPTGGKAELLLVARLEDGRWRALSPHLKEGGKVLLADDVEATADERTSDGGWILRFSDPDVRGLMRRRGTAPLPPYIRRRRRTQVVEAADLERYQTVYALEEGSIAAPTAGLHFTPELIDTLKHRGVRVAEILLHVGLGTFLPVNAEDIREHRMLPESYEIPPEARADIARARFAGARVVAVGTTATRTLESSVLADNAESGDTDLFIRPGHDFRAVDALLTNFHQPASTPLLLACAFAGRERILAAYREAIERRYRLFSYGDSMLIL